MKTQVLIIGGGPSGLLLSQLLMKEGIETVVLEKQSREHVLSRIRAGVIEPNSVELLGYAGVGERIKAEGHSHSGTILSAGDKSLRIDFEATTKKNVTVFGQTEITKDLYNAQDKLNARILHNIKDVLLNDLEGGSPKVNFQTASGNKVTITSDFIVGCDGFHGVSRSYIPNDVKKIYEKIYPFGWLGILSETPPVNEELIYANSASGFALASMRNENLSRYYIQCPSNTKVEDINDEMFWKELKMRLPKKYAETLVTGPSIEKSIAPLRSFVCEPIQWGNLFLVGDAAHIVPPTGAKGLNLAFADVYYLSTAIKDFYSDGSKSLLSSYSEIALKRIWKTVRFSWWLTSLLHTFPSSSDFERKLQISEIEYLSESLKAQATLAENYVGLPY
ncbi:MAG: 4-hydroxybenzoate 3-monooxygenase [Rickettsiales bacterium]|nr:4-hydroxybenzoate 3-monooxygenase [Rickettsiales bacterium]